MDGGCGRERIRAFSSSQWRMFFVAFLGKESISSATREGQDFGCLSFEKKFFFFLIDVLLFFAAYAVTNTDDRKSVNIITLK